jgi:hypothetical protein
MNVYHSRQSIRLCKRLSFRSGDPMVVDLGASWYIGLLLDPTLLVHHFTYTTHQ